MGMKARGPMKMYCDNNAAISLANNPVIYDHTKYVEIDRHFIKEMIDSNELILFKLLTCLLKGSLVGLLRKI